MGAEPRCSSAVARGACAAPCAATSPDARTPRCASRGVAPRARIASTSRHDRQEPSHGRAPGCRPTRSWRRCRAMRSNLATVPPRAAAPRGHGACAAPCAATSPSSRRGLPPRAVMALVPRHARQRPSRPGAGCRPVRSWRLCRAMRSNVASVPARGATTRNRKRRSRFPDRRRTRAPAPPPAAEQFQPAPRLAAERLNPPRRPPLSNIKPGPPASDSHNDCGPSARRARRCYMVLLARSIGRAPPSPSCGRSDGCCWRR
jgi:hypothetical protein